MARDPRFSILLPPGWVRIPVDDETDYTFAQLLDGILDAAPVDRRGPLRAMLESSIRETLSSARAEHAIDLIISLAPVRGLPLPVSLTVSLLEVPGTLPAQEQLLAFARGSARAVELDGQVAIRRSSDSPGRDDAPAHRTIGYIVHLPWTGEWLLFTAGILTTDEPGYEGVLDALEELMDAMLSTVRFSRKAVPA